MKDRAHHGIWFMTGLALVLALSASACVAGEVGDEDETQAQPSAARAGEARDAPRSGAALPSATDPTERAEGAEGAEAASDEGSTDGDVAAPCVEAPHEGIHDVGPRRCPLGRGAVKLDADPPKELEPPPNPW